MTPRMVMKANLCRCTPRDEEENEEYEHHDSLHLHKSRPKQTLRPMQSVFTKAYHLLTHIS